MYFLKAVMKNRFFKWSGLILLGLCSMYSVWFLLTSVPLRTVRLLFNVDAPSRFAAIELISPLELNDWNLNGKSVPVSFRGMLYSKIPAIPSSLLVRGENVLQTVVPLLPQFSPLEDMETVGESFDLTTHDLFVKVRVFGLTNSSPCLFTIGPVLGCAGTDFFTIACQTNMPVSVRLEVAGRVLDSPEGAVHSWRVDGLQPGHEYDYRLSAAHPLTGKTMASDLYHFKTFTTADEFTFVACGDNRSNTEIWNKVSTLINKQKTAFLIHTGDMVKKGRIYEYWLREMFEPSAALLARVPVYPVIGNHDDNADIFQRMFSTPSGRTNWEQQIGAVHIIGIDGQLDWQSRGKPYAWLKGVLSRSRAPFIFLVTHYPPFSSSSHGTLKGGVLTDPAGRQCRDFVLPLLERYHATAIITGHSHGYERSELDGDITLLTSAGAGAGLTDKRKDAERQNPYSRVFTKSFNIIVFQVKGSICEMKAFDLGGKVLDMRSWQARSGV